MSSKGTSANNSILESVEVRSVGEIVLVSSTSSSPKSIGKDVRHSNKSNDDELRNFAETLERKYGNRLLLVNDIREVPTIVQGNLQCLSALSSLTSLDLNGLTFLGGSLAPLESLTNLSWLSLAGCESLCGSLHPIASLISLKHLDLSSGDEYASMAISGDVGFFKALTRLEYLDVSNCNGTCKANALLYLPLHNVIAYSHQCFHIFLNQMK